MATTTPNFGWPVPTSGDLVKNGATAIEALGDAIDASMVDLEGGTTGQILSKASNTDMDFAWITNDVGDITAVTAGTGLTGGGTSGAVSLAIDPTYAGFTNLNYIANPVINSAFQVWQRGTSVAAAAATATYTADRWQILSSGNATTTSRQVTGDTTNLPNIQYCARVQRNAGQTSTSGVFYANSFESINSIPYAGKTVTISFYARKGADYSSASSNLSVRLYSGTGTDQNINGTYTGTATVVTATQTLTTTWQRFSASGSVSASATELAISPFYTPSGTAGANDYFEITGVQIDVGSVALPFRTAGDSYQEELAMCQRYFYNFTTNASADTSNLVSRASTTNAVLPINLPVPMRSAPTLVSTASGASTFGRVVSYDTSFTVGVGTVSAVAIGVALPNTGGTTYTEVVLTNGSLAGTQVYASWDSFGANACNLSFSAEL